MSKTELERLAALEALVPEVRDLLRTLTDEVRTVCQLTTRHDEQLCTVRSHIHSVWWVVGLVAGALVTAFVGHVLMGR